MSIANQIAQLMVEQMPSPGTTSTMSGAAQAQSATMGTSPGEAVPPMPMDLTGEMEEEDCQFRPEDIAAAKDLIAMVGSADRVRELIDKVDEALEVFDDGEQEAEAIDLVASLIPEVPDMPMQKSFTRISSMSDPGGHPPGI
jgi:hypothetical protein